MSKYSWLYSTNTESYRAILLPSVPIFYSVHQNPENSNIRAILRGMGNAATLRVWYCINVLLLPKLSWSRDWSRVLRLLNDDHMSPPYQSRDWSRVLRLLNDDHVSLPYQ